MKCKKTTIFVVFFVTKKMYRNTREELKAELLSQFGGNPITSYGDEPLDAAFDHPSTETEIDQVVDALVERENHDMMVNALVSEYASGNYKINRRRLFNRAIRAEVLGGDYLLGLMARIKRELIEQKQIKPKVQEFLERLLDHIEDARTKMVDEIIRRHTNPPARDKMEEILDFIALSDSQIADDKYYDQISQEAIQTIELAQEEIGYERIDPAELKAGLESGLADLGIPITFGDSFNEE